MKLHFLVICALLLFSCTSMRVGPDAQEEQKEYSTVLELPNKSKDELFVASYEWWISEFDDADLRIKYQDKDAGKIIGKYITRVEIGVGRYDVKSTFSMDIKDDRVRLSFKEPFYKSTSKSINNSSMESIPRRKSKYTPIVKIGGIEKIREDWILISSDLNDALSKDTSW